MPQSQISRRQLIKILAATAGTAILSSVPNKWKTPVVQVGVLPAHAQGSLRTGTITGYVYNTPVGNLSGEHLFAPKIAGIPVSDATISVDGTSLHSAPTGQDGAYTVTNVPAGTYNLSCVNTSNLFPNPDHINGVVVTAGGTTPNQDFFLNIG